MAIVYVDGESHFIRSEKCWQKIHGPDARLESISCPELNASPAFPNGATPYVRINREAKFLWDTGLHQIYHNHPPLVITKGIYFTSCVADEDQIHTARVNIRKQGFEPDVIKEPSMLAKQRKASLERDRYIEKPKGVDIRLAVRMLEDAYRGLYNECMLLTSDVDFIPVIESVQRMGKHVYVFGYRDGMGSNSSFEYIPHKFIDLEERMRQYNCIIAAS